jgi:hypothetical protein
MKRILFVFCLLSFLGMHATAQTVTISAAPISIADADWAKFKLDDGVWQDCAAFKVVDATTKSMECPITVTVPAESVASFNVVAKYGRNYKVVNNVVYPAVESAPSANFIFGVNKAAVQEPQTLKLNATP